MSFYSATVLGLVPTAYWQMGEASGNLTDSSGGGFTATTHGTVTYGQGGPLTGDTGTAILFDGSTGYFNLANIAVAANSPLTLMAWVYPTSVAANTLMGVICQLNGYSVFVNAGSNPPAVNLGNEGAGNINSNGTIPLNAWSFIVGIINGASSQIFINGAADSVSGTVNTRNSASANILGAETAVPGLPYTGRIAQAAIFTKVLTAAQIAYLYSIGHGGPPPPQIPPGQTIAMPQAVRPGSLAGVQMALVVTPGNVPNFAPDGVWMIQEVMGAPPASVAAGVRMVKPIAPGQPVAAPAGVIPVVYVTPGMTSNPVPGAVPVLKVNQALVPV